MKDYLLKINLVKNNEWLDKYINLIDANRNTKKVSFITQEHHIIPKYYFNNNNLDVDESNKNKVHLKFKDHILAHYYLMKCSSCTKYELANANAINHTIANPHSIDVEKWIEDNSKLLEDINKRRCELLSINHADVSGLNNPRCTKIYQFDLDGNLEYVYPMINMWSDAVGISAGSLRSMITGKRNPYKMLLINDKIYSKNKELNKNTLIEYLQFKQKIYESKRANYKFKCENCGKEYVIKMRKDEFEKRKNTRHFCYACTISGKMFKGIKFTDEHRQKISESKKKEK